MIFYVFLINILDRVITICVSKGYMELEETLLQWKQKSHLLDRLQVRNIFLPNPAHFLQPAEMQKSPNLSPNDKAYLGNTFEFK